MNTSNEFSRTYVVDRLPTQGVEFRVGADAVERSAVAARLHLVRLDALEASGRITSEGSPDLIGVRGVLHARLVQSCVVTFDEVPATLDIPWERLFTRQPDEVEAVIDPEDVEPEPLDSAQIDVGELVVEELSLGLDPRPRASGADEVMREFATDPEDNPFAVLRARSHSAH